MDSLYIEFETKCDICGHSLEVQVLPAGMNETRPILRVTPCQSCFNSRLDAENEKSNLRGKLAAYEQLFEQLQRIVNGKRE